MLILDKHCEIIIKKKIFGRFRSLGLFQFPVMFIEFSASMTAFIGIIKDIISML